MKQTMVAGMAVVVMLSSCATGSKSTAGAGAASAEQPPAAVARTDVKPCTEPNACVQSIYGRIIKHWQIPTNTDPSLSAVLQVSLNEDFSLSGVRVVQSSGQSGFDQSIESAITQAAPFSELQGLDGKQDLSNFRQFEIGFESKMKQTEASQKRRQAVQQLLNLPCSQVTRQLAQFQRDNPKQPLAQSPLLTMTTGAVMLSAESLPTAQQQALLASLPTAYTKLQSQCRKKPKATLGQTLQAQLPAGSVTF